MTKNPNLITEQDKIISNIKNMVIEREKQVIDINQNANIKKYSHEYPYKNDNLVIDCKSEENCVDITLDLINSGITNLELLLSSII